MEDMTLDELDELEDEEEERILEQYRQARMAEIKSLQAQCTPSIFNLDQKFHGLLILGALIYIRQIRISQEKNLSYVHQYSNSKKVHGTFGLGRKY